MAPKARTCSTSRRCAPTNVNAGRPAKDLVTRVVRVGSRKKSCLTKDRGIRKKGGLPQYPSVPLAKKSEHAKRRGSGLAASALPLRGEGLYAAATFARPADSPLLLFASRLSGPPDQLIQPVNLASA